MRRSISVSLFLVLLFAVYTPFAVAENFIPDRPDNYVNDYAGIIDSYDEQRINQLCRDLEKKTTAQIVVATFQNIGDANISDFTFDLFKKWKVGKTKQDNGILIVRSVNPEHHIRVEVGPGLQGILPDGKVGGILGDIKPYFDQGKVGEGLYLGISSMAKTIESEGITATRSTKSNNFTSKILLFVFLPIIFIIIFTKLLTGPVCPRCRKKVITEEQIVDPATEYHSGRGIRNYICRECGYSYTKEFDIPRIVGSHTTIWIDNDDDDYPRGGGFFGGSGGGDWSDNSDFGGGGGGDCDGGGAERDW